MSIKSIKIMNGIMGVRDAFVTQISRDNVDVKKKDIITLDKKGNIAIIKSKF